MWYTIDYYSDVKKNEIMPSTSTWMDLEMTVLSEVGQKKKRQIPCTITYTWNLKSDTNERIYKTDSQM